MLKLPESLNEDEIEEITSHGNRYVDKYFPKLQGRLPLTDVLHVQRMSGLRELVNVTQQADLKAFVEWLDNHSAGEIFMGETKFRRFCILPSELAELKSLIKGNELPNQK